jgi:hypothetical protein
MPYLQSTYILTLALLILLTACGKTSKPSAERAAPEAQTTAAKTFGSPAEAGAALLAAAQSGDHSAMLAVLGPDAADLVFSGDQARDSANLHDFAFAYTRMNRWGEIKAGGQTLYIGPDNYAFPVPLGHDAAGRWSFDTAAGRDEILARRIGNHELAAIAACQALVDAQRQYSQNGGRYARQFVSDPGRRNGLYWPSAEGQPASPLGQLGEFGKAVVSSSAGQAPLFNGYYYRILSAPEGKPGEGFAILAYPAGYRTSGLMSFIAAKDGAVYQKDLGENTADAAPAITAFHPADGWSVAMTHTGAASRAR